MRRTDEIQRLVAERDFQEQLKERKYTIYLHERLPAYWSLQYDLLLAVKSIFDKITPKGATVVFPNRTLRYPSAETNVLLNLLSIQNAREGVQIWVNYLAQKGMLQLNGQDWQAAFRRTQTGYQLWFIQLEDETDSWSTAVTTISSRQDASNKHIAFERMTDLIERTYNETQSSNDAPDDTYKDMIGETARDMLSLFMEPVPLNFAIKNYGTLMKTSYDAGSCIRSSNVIFRVLLDVDDARTSISSSEVKIVIVRNVSEVSNRSPSTYSYGVENITFDHTKIMGQGKRTVCIVSLLSTGFSSCCGHGYQNCCKYLEIPHCMKAHQISADFMRNLLL
ncbi:hypothetical protein EK21DRAFT_93723 [Setomelanomma holmii]|uniref:Uncharacterized protein n=1 Tax=Setomelanomma holmii TaxID=210430 RepID=A0A9P4GZA4_9PLEO|nr:hypothetical protein EK21DRAFT_93723 [Setomelanomma holmii]